MKKCKIYFEKLRKTFSDQGGFSLTELMIAVSIIGAASAVSAAQVDDVLALARDANRKANIRQVQTALSLYYDDHGSYPLPASGSDDGGNWQELKTALEAKQSAPYMPAVPVDPLNKDAYVFKYWSDGQAFKLSYETEDPLDESPQVVWGL